jgi:alkylation response protein AidB-like acyl-CoA dehydrogenase
VEFGLSEEQVILQDSVRRLFEEQSPLDKVREIAEIGTGFDEGLWQSFIELGILGAIVPEQYGGSGMNFFDAFIILEAAGRSTAPAPLLGSMIMAPIALLQLGSEEQKDRYLPQLAGGDCKVGIAATESINRREDAALNLEGNTLSGKALFVIDAGVADLFLVVVSSDTLVLVEREAVGFAVNSLPTVDKTRCVAELLFDNVEVEILGETGGANEAITKMLDGGRIALAADTLGAADVMIEKAVAYAQEREQFNRPIGSFQAVKHMCADMVADLEPARSLVWYAAHAYDFVPEDARLMACHAKAHMSEVGSTVAKTSVEVHGGMGFTDLLGLHYWFKRIGLNRQLLGGPEQIRHEAAVIQEWIAA